MVTLTTVSGKNATAELLISKWASSDDYARAEIMQSLLRRQEILLGRAALRALLAHTTGSKDWHIGVDTNGKPYTHSRTGNAGPHISLSHTKGLVACAVSEINPVGIDVEYWRKRDYTALADYAFGPDECEAVAKNGHAAFYRIWTLREAIAKMSGLGVMAGFDGHDCMPGKAEMGFWTRPPWQMYYVSPQPNYSLALATQGQTTWSAAAVQSVDLTKTG